MQYGVFINSFVVHKNENPLQYAVYLKSQVLLLNVYREKLKKINIYTDHYWVNSYISTQIVSKVAIKVIEVFIDDNNSQHSDKIPVVRTGNYFSKMRPSWPQIKFFQRRNFSHVRNECIFSVPAQHKYSDIFYLPSVHIYRFVASGQYLRAPSALIPTCPDQDCSQLHFCQLELYLVVEQ